MAFIKDNYVFFSCEKKNKKKLTLRAIKRKLELFPLLNLYQLFLLQR